LSSLKRTIAPSDLRGEHARVTVAGRMRVSDAPGVLRFTLTDAFSSLPVSFAEPPLVGDMDLVVIEARASAGSLAEATIVTRHVPKTTAVSASDVARFSELGTGPALRARARAIGVIRNFFEREAFLEVETPALVVCPGLDTHLDAFEVAETSRYLITSPEYQMKRLLVGGVPRCFQLARCFRRGESGGRHNPEFTMLEWYRAFAGFDAVIDDTEAIVCDVLSQLGNPLALALGRPFARISVTDAFRAHAAIDEVEMLRLAQDDCETFFRVLIEKVEPALEAAHAPVFLTHYPASMASLARLCPADPRYAERFELYAGGIELCNGFDELTDPVEQRARFERDQQQRTALGKPSYPIDERFLSALEIGMPPAAGNALGVDRLLMLALGASSIADVIAFPVELT